MKGIAGVHSKKKPEFRVLKIDKQCYFEYMNRRGGAAF